MRLVMFRNDGIARLGVLRENEVVDVAALSATVSWSGTPPTLLALIKQGDAGLSNLRSLLEQAERPGLRQEWLRPLSVVELLAPLDPPCGNVVAVGRNYAEHAAELARAAEGQINQVTLFTKAQASVTDPYADISIDPAVSKEIDWEAELGVVIGRFGKNVSSKDALDYVFGYTVINDLTARDMQYGWGGQFFKGKSLDGFCPMGPCLVTADELPDPQNLQVRLRVNGETKQDASTATMLHPVHDLIARLSLGMTLFPGTVIATGTPPGVGFARTPPEYLEPGDLMETEVEGIGLLRNRIVPENG